MNISLITGGSSGIGQSTALQLSRQGNGVIVTYRNNPDGAEATVEQITRSGGTAAAVPLDVGNVETFDGFVEDVRRCLKDVWQADRLTSLVNNAGLSRALPFDQMDVGTFDELSDALLKGPYFLTQRLLPLLADGGAIVNTSSNAAGLTGLTPGYSAYGALKGAVVVWTRYLAKELSPRGIRVNSVAPGPTRTRLGDDGFAKHPELIAPLAAQTALGRIGEGDDIAGVIAFLLSDDARWITGQDIEASGGSNL